VLSLVAVVHGLDVRGDFRQALALAAERAGVPLDEGASHPHGDRATVPRPILVPAAPIYPPRGEVDALWASCLDIEHDPAALAWIESRFVRADLDIYTVIDRIGLYGLARALPAGPLPSWARCGVPWNVSHRIVVPMFDASGVMRSLRAIRTDGGTERKRVAPSGFSTAGLLMADPMARRVLREGPAVGPLDVGILEGEPDWLTRALAVSDSNDNAPALFGLVSGAWSAAFAGRIADGSRVAVRTHVDDAGDGYAAAVVESFRGRNKIQVFDLTARRRLARGAS
jgi:hypothetical protein